MTRILASPQGIALTYFSLFNAGLPHKSSRVAKSKSSEYFWRKAITGPVVGSAPKDDTADAFDDAWFDVHAPPVLDDSGNESIPKVKKVSPQRRKKRFTKIRRIVFKDFVPGSDATRHRSNTVASTESIGRGAPTNPHANNFTTSLGSWKLKTNGAKIQVQKVIATIKTRVSASSPGDQLPKTWEEYDIWYANEQIDILNPPLPPMTPKMEGDIPSAYQGKLYVAPQPTNERARQLVLNRLGIFGKKGFDATEEGAARAKARTEIGDKLMEEGTLPTSLDEDWERRASLLSEKSGIRFQVAQGLLDGSRDAQSPPETLEQHPIFRKIVKQCRELFGTDLCTLSVLDEDRQIFLAEAGGGGIRDTPRDVTLCAHTILSGRKGFAVLDTLKDWRFENSPLTKQWNSRFYAGVPIFSPNLDGSQESEDNLCPIGTLCIVDRNPRDSFSVEDRKRFLCMSEYARREIEKWFAKKMERKMETLTAGQEQWNHELKRVISSPSDECDSLESEVLSAHPASKPSGFRRLASMRSNSTVGASFSSLRPNLPKSPPKTGPGLFEDVNVAVKPKMRKVFDVATKLIAETLDLSLVYLTAVVPHTDSQVLGNTRIISGHNIPLPVPVFDAGLHLRVLRAPEGGFLYQNPSVKECEEAFLQPQGPGMKPYASALLIAVGTEAQPTSGGFVLAGYTDDPKRVFGAEDVNFMKEFAHQLSVYTARLQL